MDLISAEGSDSHALKKYFIPIKYDVSDKSSASPGMSGKLWSNGKMRSLVDVETQSDEDEMTRILDMSLDIQEEWQRKYPDYKPKRTYTCLYDYDKVAIEKA